VDFSNLEVIDNSSQTVLDRTYLFSGMELQKRHVFNGFDPLNKYGESADAEPAMPGWRLELDGVFA